MTSRISDACRRQNKARAKLYWWQLTYAELHRVYWPWLTYRVPRRLSRPRCISLHGTPMKSHGDLIHWVNTFDVLRDRPGDVPRTRACDSVPPRNVFGNVNTHVRLTCDFVSFKGQDFRFLQWPICVAKYFKVSVCQHDQTRSRRGIVTEPRVSVYIGHSDVQIPSRWDACVIR